MSNLCRISTLLLALPLLAAPVFLANAQANPGTQASDELVKTITGLDAALFDAYNRCDLDKFGALLADDLEFYHDQTGLAVGKQKTIDGVKNNICGKVHRELVPGTLEVYPIHGFGAVEICVHRFSHPAQPAAGGSRRGQVHHALAIQGRRLEGNAIISFDHHGLAK